MRSQYKVSLLITAACIIVSLPAFAREEASMASEKSQTASTKDTIIVEGRSFRTTTTPVDVLSGEELIRRRQGTLGETLSGLPGVHMDNFGGGASRPVIRGQTVPRIEILSDGAELFDASSVSPDHAVVTDPLLLDAIEVQRGPAAVVYGGDAVNGAVNLIDSKVPKALPEDGIDGAGEARYSTADDGTAFAGRATMAVGPFALHVEGSASDLNNYDVPDDYGSDKLRDSFAQNTGYSVGASWITDKGYIGAAYTVHEAEYGLPGHSHLNGVCHTHGSDLHCEAHDEYTDPFGSSDDHTAHIELRSERVDVRVDYEKLLPGIDHTRLRFSYTDYIHEEIDGPSLFSRYTNEVYDGRLELTHAPFFGFTGTIGAQYTDGTFSGLDLNLIQRPTSVTSIIYFFGSYEPPIEFVTENIGIFLSEGRSFGAVDVEFAIRKDWREITRPMPDFVLDPIPEAEAIIPIFIAAYGEDWFDRYIPLAEEDFIRYNPGAKHKPLSASLGATWHVNADYSVSLSLAHTERAPNVRELYAYGNNLATNSYELGLSQRTRASSSFPENTTDVMEKANSFNLTVRKTQGPTQFEVGFFYQDVNDYIFARHLETEDETGVPHNYLMYVAADAALTGIDGQVSHQLSPESRVTVFGDYVYTNLADEDDHLPRIPPARLGARYNWESGPLSADLEYYHTFSQGRIAAYETKTDGYEMLGASIGYRLDLSSGRMLELYARGSNLTNELAYVHTSFVKDQSPLRGRNVVLGVRTAF